MKQGTGKSSYADYKTEPKAKAMSVPAVGALGISKVYVKPIPTLHAGRGYNAPGIDSSTHPSGSQGKHK